MEEIKIEEYPQMAVKYYPEWKMWIGFKNGVPMLFSADGKKWNEFYCLKRRDEMTGNEYQSLALRTVSPIPYAEKEDYTDKDILKLRIVEGVMGLCGEAGECSEIVKKSIFQGHKLSEKELAEELGDVAWYLAVTASSIGYNLDDIFKMNIEKLEKRYPNGFEENRSIFRDDI